MYIMIACFRISDAVVPLKVCDDEATGVGDLVHSHTDITLI